MMFCPKCGKSNTDDIKYCRSCGVGLEKVGDVLRMEISRLESENRFFNERFFRRLGFGFLFAFLAVGFGFLFALAVYFKFRWFGAELMGYFAIFGFVLLGFLSALFFGVQRYMGNSAISFDDSVSETSRLDEAVAAELGPGSVEDARSVTENTTELLDARVKNRR